VPRPKLTGRRCTGAQRLGSLTCKDRAAGGGSTERTAEGGSEQLPGSGDTLRNEPDGSLLFLPEQVPEPPFGRVAAWAPEQHAPGLFSLLPLPRASAATPLPGETSCMHSGGYVAPLCRGGLSGVRSYTSISHGADQPRRSTSRASARSLCAARRVALLRGYRPSGWLQGQERGCEAGSQAN
jgi:hypothetical protein